MTETENEIMEAFYNASKRKYIVRIYPEDNLKVYAALKKVLEKLHSDEWKDGDDASYVRGYIDCLRGFQSIIDDVENKNEL